MVEVMKIMAHPSKCPMHALLHSVPLTLQQATVDLLLHQRHSEGSNKPCAHQDPETPQSLSQNCVSLSPRKVQVSSGLPQG